MAQPKPDLDAAGLEQQIALLRADLARISETLAALGQTSGDTLRATFAEKAETLLARGEAKIDEAGHKAQATLADMSDFARRKPIEALAIAGGAGLLLGLLFGRH